MELGLTGRRAVVTGGSKGIGRAIAAEFVAEGAAVAICSRHPGELDATAAELRKQAGGEDAGRIRLGALRRPDRGVLEHAGAARDRNQDHHAGEQAERIPVDAAHRFGLIEHADQNHQRGAEKRQHVATLDPPLAHPLAPLPDDAPLAK